MNTTAQTKPETTSLQVNAQLNLHRINDTITVEGLIAEMRKTFPDLNMASATKHLRYLADRGMLKPLKGKKEITYKIRSLPPLKEEQYPEPVAQPKPTPPANGNVITFHKLAEEPAPMPTPVKEETKHTKSYWIDKWLGKKTLGYEGTVKEMLADIHTFKGAEAVTEGALSGFLASHRARFERRVSQSAPGTRKPLIYTLVNRTGGRIIESGEFTGRTQGSLGMEHVPTPVAAEAPTPVERTNEIILDEILDLVAELASRMKQPARPNLKLATKSELLAELSERMTE